MLKIYISLILIILILPFSSLSAQAVHVPTIDSGDTAWMLIATAFVLFMSIPGLALFYGGLVRRKNVLSVFMQIFVLVALISIEWVVIG